MLANAHVCRVHFPCPAQIDPLKQRMLHALRMMNSQEIPGSIAVLLILLTVMIQMIWAKAMPWSWLLL